MGIRGKIGGDHWLLRGAVIGVAIVVALVAWQTSGDDEAAPPGSARIVEADEVSALAAAAGHPVYWLGPKDGFDLELTEGADGSVQVRYLRDGAEPGSNPAGFTAVATYPVPDPKGALEGFAARPGSEVHRGRRGRRVVTSREAPNSAYFASPNNAVQVEVYDPEPKAGLRLASSGAVRQAGR